MGGGHSGEAKIKHFRLMKISIEQDIAFGMIQIVDGGSEMPGTYHKMDEGEGGGRRHKHRHHSHHKHRHSERERSESKHGDRDRGQHGVSHPQPSTDTSLEFASNMRQGGGYEDSLYNPKDSLYGPGPGAKDSLYSGEDNSGGQHQSPSAGGGRSYGSGSDTRLTSPGRYSDGGRHHSDKERHGENTFDHVSKGGHHGGQRRSQEERIWQDPVSRGAESGQIRAPTDIQNIYLPGNSENGGQRSGHRKPEQTASHIRGWIEPGRPGSGLAAAAALVRGDSYTPEKITTGGKVKVPPPVPVKPSKPGYNKMGMDELWPGGWEEYSEYNVYLCFPFF